MLCVQCRITSRSSEDERAQFLLRYNVYGRISTLQTMHTADGFGSLQEPPPTTTTTPEKRHNGIQIKKKSNGIKSQKNPTQKQQQINIKSHTQIKKNPTE
jgi:hypothetical protein